MEYNSFVPSDDVNPELIPAIEQWRIDKSSDMVDRLLKALSKDNTENNK